MERGDVILVRAYPDKLLERVVLDVARTYVVACRPEMYEHLADARGLPDAAMGFPIGDVVEVRGKMEHDGRAA